eukprot:1328507-Pleurochrysis_carterae.AAC.6
MKFAASRTAGGLNSLMLSAYGAYHSSSESSHEELAMNVSYYLLVLYTLLPNHSSIRSQTEALGRWIDPGVRATVRRHVAPSRRWASFINAR